MPDFEGANIVELQPEDVKIPVQFKITVCTAASANNGFLPYGYTAVLAPGSSATTVTAVKYPSGNSASSSSVPNVPLIDGAIVLSASVITVPLTWPTKTSSSGSAVTSMLGAGTYHLTFRIRLSGASVVQFREANFNRVFVRDK